MSKAPQVIGRRNFQDILFLCKQTSHTLFFIYMTTSWNTLGLTIYDSETVGNESTLMENFI